MAEKITLTKIKNCIKERCKDCQPIPKEKDENLCKNCFLSNAPTLDNITKYCKECCNRNNPKDTCCSTNCSLYPIMLTLFESKEKENG